MGSQGISSNQNNFEQETQSWKTQLPDFKT